MERVLGYGGICVDRVNVKSEWILCLLRQSEIVTSKGRVGGRTNKDMRQRDLKLK